MDSLLCETCGKELTQIQIKNYYQNKSKHPYCSTTCWGKRPREHNYDDTFLDEDSDLAAYFAGWFVSDGHFAKASKDIKLVSVDKQLVDDFLRIINYRNAVHVRYPDGKKNVGCNPQYGFAVSGNVRKRIEEMGYLPGSKTGWEFFPDRFYNDNWFFSFLRGFIDGDGTIRLGKTGDLQLSMVSASCDLLMDIYLFMFDRRIVTGGTVAERRLNKERNINTVLYRLAFGHKDSVSICNHLYANATIKLERKYNNYIKGKERVMLASPAGSICKYDGCIRRARIRGYCKKHYDKTYQAWHSAANRDAINARNKKWRELNRNRCLAVRRLWYEKNKDKENARSRQWKKDHSDSVRMTKLRYRMANRDKVNASKRSYRDRNIERVREQEKSSYRRNRENKLAWHRQYKEKNHEKILKQAEEYRNRPEVKARNTEYWKEYEKKNKAKRQEYRRQYYLRKKAEREAAEKD